MIRHAWAIGGLLAICAVLDVCPAIAQTLPRQTASTTAAVQGILRDENGLGLGGARIALAGPQNPTATTSGDGVFRILNLAPGRYSLTIQLDGFRPITRDTLLAPGLPEPTLVMSMPRLRATITALGNVPSRYAGSNSNHTIDTTVNGRCRRLR